MSIKYAVLGLLHYKDMYGYQIKDHIEKNFGSMWTVNYGQIYTTLKTLVDESLINLAEIVPSDVGAPNKKLYSLTEKGREEFSRWLTAQPEKQILMRDPFLTRFIFFGFGERAVALKQIEEQIKFYEEQIGRRKVQLGKWEKKGMYVRMMAELGLDFNEMILKWLYRTKIEIAESEENRFQASVSDIF